MLNYIKYLEIPYVEDGRGWQGCDCYGLIMLWFAEELGIEIPDLGLPYQCTLPLETLEQLHSDFERVVKPQRHDLVLIRKDPDTHVGVCMSPKEFMHTLSAGCHIADIYVWRRNILGFYRHKSQVKE